MRAMPKTLDTQGLSGLREEVVRPQSSSSCSSVLKEIIAALPGGIKNPENESVFGVFFLP